MGHARRVGTALLLMTPAMGRADVGELEKI